MKWLQHIQRYDEVSYLWFITVWKGNLKAFLARAVSMSGDGWMYAVICLALVIRGDAQAFELFFLLLIAYAVEVPLYIILKNTLRRQRPCQRLKIGAVIQACDKFSFPSGHTAAAFLFAVVGSHFYPDSTLLLFSWASAIGLSRVALGVHYPTDILAGAGLGSVLGIVVLALSVAEMAGGL